jgi:flagellar hook assembly protein FlgD
LYVGFWETTSLVGVEETPFQGSVSTINNFPNPASEQTRIKYDLPESANVSLRIYDLSGKLLKVIYSGFQNAGAQEVEYNLTDENGTKLTSGTYMYELAATPYNAAGGGFSPIHLRNAMIIQR